MAIINIPDRFSDNFGDPIQKLFELIDNLSKLDSKKEIILDCSKAKFTHPFFSMALPLLVEQYKRNAIKVRCVHDFENLAVKGYMKSILFPEGLDPRNHKSDKFAKALNYYKTKNYIPIIKFPCGEDAIVVQIRDGFLSSVNKLLVEICKLEKQMVTALMYLIDEAVNNVLHHSGDESGYLLAQYYPSKGYVELVVADIGKTILETYLNFERYKNEVTDHELAMEAAIAGKSTKSLTVDRGFGISTSKRMLTEGLNGKYFIYSGNVFNIHTSEINTITALPQEIFWQGVYVCLRIPTIPPISFNPSDYYE